jgi:hypothetical protein
VHTVGRIAGPCQGLHVSVKAPHENVVKPLFSELSWTSPHALASELLEPGLVCGNLGVLGISRSTKGQVLHTVLMTGEHLGVLWNLVSGDCHGSNHVFRLAFEEKATTACENRVTREHAPVDIARLLVSLGEHRHIVLLTFACALR